jgi:hypothetical protein
MVSTVAQPLKPDNYSRFMMTRNRKGKRKADVVVDSGDTTNGEGASLSKQLPAAKRPRSSSPLMANPQLPSLDDLINIEDLPSWYLAPDVILDDKRKASLLHSVFSYVSINPQWREVLSPCLNFQDFGNCMTQVTKDKELSKCIEMCFRGKSWAKLLG